tara:strand:- start:506 stop:1645 length:1140 start_codon:yes stop_codon:yes gene_type:complete
MNYFNLFKYFLYSLIVVCLSSNAIASNDLNKIRTSYDESQRKIRVVFDASNKIDFQIKNRKNKSQIYLQLKNIKTSKNFKKTSIDKKYFKKFTLKKIDKNLDFKLSTNYEIQYKYFSLKPNKNYGHRLVLDVYLIKKNTVKAKKQLRNYSNKIFVIAIDAGHGGKDPGAVGKRGTKEKDIVLSIAKKLNKLLKKEKNIKPILIRNKDSYLSLRQRINKARRYKADLFLSIHANASKNRKASGSSVYVLSQHGATSEQAKWLANKENSSDLIGGASIDDKDQELAQVLLDLSQSVTIETSLKASRIVLKKLKKISKLQLDKTEQAGFVVLKSPDIPSILIETAFLSNPKEEKKLKTKKFQKNIAKAIRDAILEMIKKGII